MSTTERGVPTAPSGSSPNAHSLRRRALIRAGLTSGAVIGSLGTRSVLAQSINATTVSMWSSIAQNGPLPSQAARTPGGTIDGPSFWLGQTSYANFQNTPANTSFTEEGKDTRTSAGFSARDAALQGQTLPFVLNSGSPLAKYCVAMFLNAARANDAPSQSVMTRATAQLIWANAGVWTPVLGGPTWTLDGTLDYFEYITSNTPPSSWSTTP